MQAINTSYLPTSTSKTNRYISPNLIVANKGNPLELKTPTFEKNKSLKSKGLTSPQPKNIKNDNSSISLKNDLQNASKAAILSNNKNNVIPIKENKDIGGFIRKITEEFHQAKKKDNSKRADQLNSKNPLENQEVSIDHVSKIDIVRSPSHHRIELDLKSISPNNSSYHHKKESENKIVFNVKTSDKNIRAISNLGVISKTSDNSKSHLYGAKGRRLSQEIIQGGQNKTHFASNIRVDILSLSPKTETNSSDDITNVKSEKNFANNKIQEISSSSYQKNTEGPLRAENNQNVEKITFVENVIDKQKVLDQNKDLNEILKNKFQENNLRSSQLIETEKVAILSNIILQEKDFLLQTKAFEENCLSAINCNNQNSIKAIENKLKTPQKDVIHENNDGSNSVLNQRNSNCSTGERKIFQKETPRKSERYSESVHEYQDFSFISKKKLDPENIAPISPDIFTKPSQNIQGSPHKHFNQAFDSPSKNLSQKRNCNPRLDSYSYSSFESSRNSSPEKGSPLRYSKRLNQTNQSGAKSLNAQKQICESFVIAKEGDTIMKNYMLKGSISKNMESLRLKLQENEEELTLNLKAIPTVSSKYGNLTDRVCLQMNPGDSSIKPSESSPRRQDMPLQPQSTKESICIVDFENEGQDLEISKFFKKNENENEKTVIKIQKVQEDQDNVMTQNENLIDKKDNDSETKIMSPKILFGQESHFGQEFKETTKNKNIMRQEKDNIEKKAEIKINNQIRDSRKNYNLEEKSVITRQKRVKSNGMLSARSSISKEADSIREIHEFWSPKNCLREIKSNQRSFLKQNQDLRLKKFSKENWSSFSSRDQTTFKIEEKEAEKQSKNSSKKHMKNVLNVTTDIKPKESTKYLKVSTRSSSLNRGLKTKENSFHKKELNILLNCGSADKSLKKVNINLKEPQKLTLNLKLNLASEENFSTRKEKSVDSSLLDKKLLKKKVVGLNGSESYSIVKN